MRGDRPEAVTAPLPLDRARVADEVAAWFALNARPLPWREPSATPWGVMVSEFMLQQTPVARVLPVWEEWLRRWPTPSDLAAEEPGEAVRAWGRLGYPRRAQRLHAAAVAIRDEHGGAVPSAHDALLALPGVGEYTAAAIASFGFGARHAVLDTNVRRVLSRLEGGAEFPADHLTRAERERAASWVPAEPRAAATWAAASMELGALICTAANPACERCPVRADCAWHAAGRPAWQGPARRGQAYAGTDRQCRGVLLGVLRDAAGPVPEPDVLAAWNLDPAQASRALETLIADALVRRLPDGALAL